MLCLGPEALYLTGNLDSETKMAEIDGECGYALKAEEIR